MSSRNLATTAHHNHQDLVDISEIKGTSKPAQQSSASLEAARQHNRKDDRSELSGRSMATSTSQPLMIGVKEEEEEEAQQQQKARSNNSNPPTVSPAHVQNPWAAGIKIPHSSIRQTDQMIADNGTTSHNLAGGGNSHRVHFKSLLAPSVINESDETTTGLIDIGSRCSSLGQELIDLSSFSSAPSVGPKIAHSDNQGSHSNSNKQYHGNKQNRRQRPENRQRQVTLNETIPEEDDNNSVNQKHFGNGDIINTDEKDEHRECNFFDVDYVDNAANESTDDEVDNYVVGDLRLAASDSSHQIASPSHHKLKSRNTFASRVYHQISYFASDLKDRLIPISGSVAYTACEQGSRCSDLSTSTGAREYRRIKRVSKRKSPEQNFRGPYRYSRIGIAMTVFRKLFSFLIQRSTLALFGAFLIHVTLGTIYTLSNINSYLTSYMRKHGSPNATYGASMWISSSYAVGQGLSMILGGLIEKRFSARVACILGCALHSLSVMSTSKSIEYGQLAVFFTYGFLPGFGCGLAYMTPMSNGFGWYPDRKGLVAGTILAGFGIGTFVFNMAQTAYVNPNNLSPLPNANGYFTQDEILNNVPNLFIFLGNIYACMQFVGCCLLFKPPNRITIDGYVQGSNDDEQRILPDSTDMSFRKAIRTREFLVLFLVFGITNQGVLFVNSMLKEYGQIFIQDDLYLAWTGSMASIANSLGRLVWGLAIDRYSFTVCFTSITTIFGTLIFLMPFKMILSSKLLYLFCTLGIFGSFSGWMSTYPVHLSRIFGTRNSGMIYGLIFVSQSIGGILTAFAAHYLIDHYSRFVPFFCVTFLEILGLSIYHLFYNR